MLDLHVHLIGHLDRPANKESIRKYLNQARVKGLQEIGFADHDMYWEELNLPLIREVAREYPDLKVRAGLEVDYRPQEEGKIKSLLEQFDFDFVIGSVHEIDGWAFDTPGQEFRHRQFPSDDLYKAYFELITQAAASQLFTTIGHLDLIKIYGIRPHSDVLELADKALQAIAANGLAVEINTNGRYKPVREFYPDKRLVGEVKRRGIPLTLGSDAHQPEAVGRDLEEALKWLREEDVISITGFEQRLKVYYPILKDKQLQRMNP